VPVVVAGGLVFVSGQDPEMGGRLRYRGRIGREVPSRPPRPRSSGSVPSTVSAGGMPVEVEPLLELAAP